MQTWKRLVGVGVLVGAGILSVGSATSAGGGPAPQGTIAPEGTLRVSIGVAGLAAANIDDIVPEVYQSSAFFQNCATLESEFDPNVVQAFRTYVCSLPTGDYTLGAAGLTPTFDGYTQFLTCNTPLGSNDEFPGTNADFSIFAFATTNCRLDLATSVLILDKYVTDTNEFVPETLPDPSVFTLEVFNEPGDLFASGSDPSSNECADGFNIVLANCYVVDLPFGDYTLGEEPMPGFLGAVRGDCTQGQLADERFDTSNAAITSGTILPWGYWIRCEIVNNYVEGNVTLTKTLTNDDGGTAALTDFTLELYDSSMNLVASGVCDNAGMCLQGSYPTDDYTVGEIGPDGYTRTITQNILMPTEPLTEAGSTFTLEPFAQAEINVASDDNPTTTTTSTTTTLAPTTTAAATTTQASTTVQQTTTTALGAGGATLPETGSSDQTGSIALIAAALLGIGAAATWASRRRFS